MTETNLNMDLTQPVIIDTERLDWAPSPQPGVERRRLERADAEAGRATSIVRYRAGSAFPAHSHPGGEEYLVLDGVFSDAGGDFGVGAYVRNPPGSQHAPFTEQGCTIFVKLCQMRPRGEPAVIVDTRALGWAPGTTAGHAVMPLHTGPDETVTLDRLEPGTTLGPRSDHGGEEILVLDGTLDLAGTGHGPRTWIRTPTGASSTLASRTGCTLWIKRGHLLPR